MGGSSSRLAAASADPFWDRVLRELVVNSCWLRPDDARQLRERVRSGVPREVRGKLWQVIAQAAPLISKNRGSFDILCTRRVDGGERKYIGRDLKRTFPHHPDFASPNGRCHRQLEEVLCAYAAFNGDVGYVQGINFVCAMLLLHMPPEAAFWALVSLLKPPSARRPSSPTSLVGSSTTEVSDEFVFVSHAPGLLAGLFIPGTPTLRRSLFVLDELISRKLPQVAEQFARYDVSAPLFASEYFLTVYAAGMFPLRHAEHIWDAVFVEGGWVLFAVALVLLTVLQPAILASSSFEEILSAVRCFGQTHLDPAGSMPTTLPASVPNDRRRSTQSDRCQQPPRLSPQELVCAAVDMRLSSLVVEIESVFEHNEERARRLAEQADRRAVSDGIKAVIDKKSEKRGGLGAIGSRIRRGVGVAPSFEQGSVAGDIAPKVPPLAGDVSPRALREWEGNLERSKTEGWSKT